jgi:predicted ABC-type transport system involved in lysophospholipase L1 biosynthesis ATPase subunit
VAVLLATRSEQVAATCDRVLRIEAGELRR